MRIGFERIRHVVEKRHPDRAAEDDDVVVSALGQGAIVTFLQRLEMRGIKLGETVSHRRGGYRTPQKTKRADPPGIIGALYCR